MTDQETNLLNAFETTLTSPMGTTDLTATVATTTGLSSPCYLVIEPDVPAKREYILFDGTFTGTTFVATTIANRYLTGSAAGSGLTHAAGSVVRMSPFAQHFEDLNDRIDAIDHGSIGGLSDDDHSQYLNVGRHDANDHSALAGEHSGITAAGDIAYGSAAGIAGNILSIGSQGAVAYSTGTAPAWGTASGSTNDILIRGASGVPEWFSPLHQRNQDTGHTFTASATYEATVSRTITNPGRAVGICAIGHARFNYANTANIEMRARIRISTDGGTVFSAGWYAGSNTQGSQQAHSVNPENFITATPTGDIVIEMQVWVASTESDFTMDVAEILSWLVPA